MFKTPQGALRVKVGAYGVALGSGVRRRSPARRPIVADRVLTRISARTKGMRVWHRLTGLPRGEEVWVAHGAEADRVALALRRLYKDSNEVSIYDLARHLVR